MRFRYFAFASTLGMLSTPVLADLSDGLVAHYPFDGNAQDASGNGNDGTEYGGVSYVTGQVGQAANFDGVDDYIEINNHSSLELNRFVSISYWIAPQHQLGHVTSPKSMAVPVICKNPHTGNSYSSWITGDLNSVSFQQYPSRSGVNYTFGAAYNFTPDEYTHIVAVRDESSVKIYVNKELILEELADYDAKLKEQSLFIGYDGGYGYRTYKGLIDDVRIYNRALSESEVQQLYQGETEACGSTASGAHASFAPSTGILNIPFVDVPDAFGGFTTYSVDMTIIPGANPLSFSLSGAVPVN